MSTFDRSLIIPLPYVRGVAEYAEEARKRLEEAGDDFIVAVDLPRGLEDDVLAAVKRLPKISLIIDSIGRAIAVLPTDAAMEGVWGFLDRGYDLEFVDESVPFVSNLGCLEKLMSLAEESGPKEAIKKAGEHGISLKDLFNVSPSDNDLNRSSEFIHLAGKIGAVQYAELLRGARSDYYRSRQRYMAMRLQRLAKTGKPVFFLCNVNHWESVSKYLDEDIELPEDYDRLPTVTCRVREEDIWKISPEIPSVMHQYELTRSEGFDRVRCLSELLKDDDIGLGQKHVLQYARNLALTDGQLYPGLFNLLTAAKYCYGDAYASRILQRAIKYPLADKDSNCTIRTYVDYDLTPLAGQRILRLDLDNPIEDGWSMFRKRRGPKDFYRIRNFSRSRPTQLAEKQLADFLRGRYYHHVPSEEQQSEEFSCGLKDGIDARTTIRYHSTRKLYVSSHRTANDAAYVINFGGDADKKVYFNTRYFVVGAAKACGDRYRWSCLTMFARQPEHTEEIVHSIDTGSPMISCVEAGIRHSKNVFLFTDNREGLEYFGAEARRIKVLGKDRIPRRLLDNMGWFDVKT